MPVSAIRKLAPVMPTSAARNRSRSLVRASVRMSRRSWNTRSAGRSVCDLRNCASQSSRFRWNAGAMIWLGSSWRSWMMYSPRSVSTGVMPARSRWSLMAISSPIIDLPLVTVRAPGRLADVQHRGARVLGRGAPVHFAPGRQQLRFPGFQVEIQVGQGVVLDVARGVAQRLELRQRRHRAGAPRHELRARVGQRLLQARRRRWRAWRCA